MSDSDPSISYSPLASLHERPISECNICVDFKKITAVNPGHRSEIISKNKNKVVDKEEEEVAFVVP